MPAGTHSLIFSMFNTYPGNARSGAGVLGTTAHKSTMLQAILDAPLQVSALGDQGGHFAYLEAWRYKDVRVYCRCDIRLQICLREDVTGVRQC